MANEGVNEFLEGVFKREIEQQNHDNLINLILNGHCVLNYSDVKGMEPHELSKLTKDLEEGRKIFKNKKTEYKVTGINLDNPFVYPAFEKANLEKKIKEVMEEAYEHLAKQYPGY